MRVDKHKFTSAREAGNRKSLKRQGTRVAGNEVWTPYEHQCLLEGMALNETNDQLSLRVPGRTAAAVKKKVILLHRADHWTVEELQAMHDGVAAGKTAVEIAQTIPTRTLRAVRAQLLASGLKAKLAQLGPRPPPDGISRRKARVIHAEKETYTERRCMCCGNKFFSWGIGNRLCNEHRREGE